MALRSNLNVFNTISTHGPEPEKHIGFEPGDRNPLRSVSQTDYESKELGHEPGDQNPLRSVSQPDYESEDLGREPGDQSHRMPTSQPKFEPENLGFEPGESSKPNSGKLLSLIPKAVENTTARICKIGNILLLYVLCLSLSRFSFIAEPKKILEIASLVRIIFKFVSFFCPCGSNWSEDVKGRK